MINGPGWRGYKGGHAEGDYFDYFMFLILSIGFKYWVVIRALFFIIFGIIILLLLMTCLN